MCDSPGERGTQQAAHSPSSVRVPLSHVHSHLSPQPQLSRVRLAVRNLAGSQRSKLKAGDESLLRTHSVVNPVEGTTCVERIGWSVTMDLAEALGMVRVKERNIPFTNDCQQQVVGPYSSPGFVSGKSVAPVKRAVK